MPMTYFSRRGGRGPSSFAGPARSGCSAPFPAPTRGSTAPRPARALEPACSFRSDKGCSWRSRHRGAGPRKSARPGSTNDGRRIDEEEMHDLSYELPEPSFFGARMPKGPRGEKRPADNIGLAAMVGRIATGEIEDVREEAKSAAAS